MANSIENNLARLRRERGLSAAELAQAVGVTRQTVYAMEAESYVHNTAVALRLARVLDVAVEELFHLPDEPAAAPAPAEPAQLLPGSETLDPGQPVQLCRVGKRLMAAAPSPVPWYFPPSDAVISQCAGAETRVRIYQDADFRSRILVAGCDPGISVLARHLRPAGVELVLAHRNSSQALALLKEGVVHVAGTHLRDESTGESNLPEIARLFPRRGAAVISFAVWEEGILSARGNPKGIRGIEDFARRGVTVVNREKGAGSRRLLDSHLARLGIAPRSVRGYDSLAPGHLPAAWQVRNGAADCCIATRAAAHVFGLDFIPLTSERYDLAIRRQHMELPAIQALIDTLQRSAFRRELEGIGGYDTRLAGRQML